MPKRKWRVVGPTSYGEAKEARGNLEYRKDMAEAAKSTAEADSLLKAMKGFGGTLGAMRHLGPAKKEMDKLKEQRKFKQRKNQL